MRDRGAWNEYDADSLAENVADTVRAMIGDRDLLIDSLRSRIYELECELELAEAELFDLKRQRERV